jgi:Flp pilus assembly protein TadD
LHGVGFGRSPNVANVQKRRRFNEAIVHYKKAVQRSPDRLVAAMALNSLGIAYSKMGRSKDAVAALRMAASKNPSDPLPPANLAFEFLEVGDRVRARKWLNRALSLRKQDKVGDAAIGYLLVDGDFDVQRGTRLLEGVLRKDVKNPTAIADLAVAYRKLGNRAKARRYANRAKQLGGHDGETMRQLKRVLSAC